MVAQGLFLMLIRMTREYFPFCYTSQVQQIRTLMFFRSKTELQADVFRLGIETRADDYLNKRNMIF